MNELFLKIILLLSVLFTAAAVIRFAIAAGRALCGKRAAGGIAGYLLLFFAAIWCLRYAVGYYVINNPTGLVESNLTKFEEIFNSLIHTFQSFSMDEDYTAYISAGKDMVRQLFPKNAYLADAYGLYASVLNVLAPVLGGAILLDILQGAFPKVKLFFKQLLIWKTEYFFSELNNNSLACAESILEEKYAPFCRPVIVFTDVYTDGENEQSSELLKKAKALGGVCMNDDLVHVNYRFTAKKEFWLIDEKEIDNIKELAELANGRKWENLKKSIVRVFYQDDSYMLTESGIVHQVREKYREKIVKPRGPKNRRADEDTVESILNEKAPAILRTRHYQNMVYNILEELPLFTPLIGREGQLELDVAVLGNGSIGTEMFLSTYWCGQMNDIPLSVNMVALDEPNTATGKIDKISTEIFESAKENSPLLRIYAGKEEYNKPYFTFRYCKADVDSADISTLECTVPPRTQTEKQVAAKQLIDCDYFFVALGDDALNIRIAEKIYRAIAIRNSAEKKQKNVVITYVVYDSNLCRELNETFKIFLKNSTAANKNITLRAVGSIDKTYSFSNIIKKEYMCKKLKYDERDDASSPAGKKAFSHQEWVKLSNMMSIAENPYNFWSSYARDMHYIYKLFCVYSKECTSLEDLKNINGKNPEYICEEIDDTAIRLAWIEHRRWCAYMRANGFKQSDTKDVKLLKTHWCLVEHHLQSVDEVFYRDDGVKTLSQPDLLEEVRISKKNDDKNIIDYDYECIIPQNKLDALKKLSVEKINQFYKEC